MAVIPRYSRRYAAPRLGPVERWFLPALLLTAVLHFGGYHLLRTTHFSGFAAPHDLRPPSRVFKVQQATIDPKTLDQPEEPEKPAAKPVPDVTDIQIPGGDTKPNYEKLLQEQHDIIAAPETDKTMATEKPRVDQARTLEKAFADSGNNASAMPSDLKALTDELLKGKPNVTSSHPSFDVTGNTNGSKPNAGPNVGAGELQQPRRPAFRQGSADLQDRADPAADRPAVRLQRGRTAPRGGRQPAKARRTHGAQSRTRRSSSKGTPTISARPSTIWT